MASERLEVASRIEVVVVLTAVEAGAKGRRRSFGLAASGKFTSTKEGRRYREKRVTDEGELKALMGIAIGRIVVTAARGQEKGDCFPSTQVFNDSPVGV
jgi:hypothetical protein